MTDVLLLDTFSGKQMFIVVLLYLYLGSAAMSACLGLVTMSACLGSVAMSVCLASRRVMLGLIAMSSLEKALSWQTRPTSEEVHVTIQIFYIIVNMHFACLSSRTDYVQRQEKEKERISENQNKHW